MRVVKFLKVAETSSLSIFFISLILYKATRETYLDKIFGTQCNFDPFIPFTSFHQITTNDSQEKFQKLIF